MKEGSVVREMEQDICPSEIVHQILLLLLVVLLLCVVVVFVMLALEGEGKSKSKRDEPSPFFLFEDSAIPFLNFLKKKNRVNLL